MKTGAPDWKRVAPLSHQEVSTLIAEGAKTYQPLDFEMRTYSGKLVTLKPATNLAIPAGDAKWGTRMSTRAGFDAEIEVPAGLKNCRCT